MEVRKQVEMMGMVSLPKKEILINYLINQARNAAVSTKCVSGQTSVVT